MTPRELVAVFRPGVARTVVLALVIYLGLAVLGWATAQNMSAITGALNDANSEIRTSIFPAVSAVLGGLVVIAVAARVVYVISSSK